MNNLSINLDNLHPEQIRAIKNILAQKNKNFKSVTEVLEISDNIIEDLQILARDLSEDQLKSQLKEAEEYYNQQWEDLIQEVDEVEEKLDYILDFIKIQKIPYKPKAKTAEETLMEGITQTLDSLLKAYKS